MSLSKDYKRLVYHMAKDIISKEMDIVTRINEWTHGEMTDTEFGVIVGRAIQLGAYPELYDAMLTFESMFARDVKNLVEKFENYGRRLEELRGGDDDSE